ncbi:kinase-like protein [Lichtheimia corymbifera JMRC:FSU:9682]|uniref:non-specific serine/threonine protein kinase n=1 Tax=Lichtheimia corymbifera JMRC:FSU:9682 TaxID=1263082 RepID=A0A068S5N3_9FUNG|nr:kinase-like protein [Lichtheimia corymbifera JMRC:FSU:9682]
MGNQHSNMAHKDRQNHHFGHLEEYHLEIPDMVDDRFKVESRLGAGSFGVLHEGVNVETNQPVAIKLEPGNCRVQQLQDEYRIYRLLGGAAGFPNVYYYGHKGGYNIMVMDLLGPNLDELFGLCDHQFSQKTVAMLAKRMLRLLQVVHDLGLIYRDVKPDNFLIGRPKTDTANALFMIDFGMSKPYRDEKTGAHIPFRERGCISGTARYMSLNAHEGGEQSRRDDLESLGYVLLYLLRGSLPWQGVKEANQEAKYERIEELKRKTSIAQLCAGFTVEFSIYLHYVRKLKFDEDPDYAFCVSLFDKALKRLDAQDDEEYDWMLINDGKGWEASERKKKEPLMLTY